MGNCVRREIGYEIDDETDAPEIIDKIKLMKNKTKAKQNFKFEEKLSSVEMNDDEIEPVKYVAQKPPEERVRQKLQYDRDINPFEQNEEFVEEEEKKEEEEEVEEEEEEEEKKEEEEEEDEVQDFYKPDIVEEIKEEPQRRRRVMLGDFIPSHQKQITLRDSHNVKNDLDMSF